MKKIIFLLLLFFSSRGFSQVTDMMKGLEESTNDSVKIELLIRIYDHVFELNADSANYYFIQIKSIAKQQNDKIIEALNLSQMGYYLFKHGDVPQGLNLNTQALRMAEMTNNARALGIITFGKQYFTRDINKRIGLIRRALDYSAKAKDQYFMTYEYRNLGHIYLSLKNYDSAFYYHQKAYDMARKTNQADDIAAGLMGLGRTNYAVGNKKISLEFFKSAIELQHTNSQQRLTAYHEISNFFKMENNIDSAIYYANISYAIAKASRSVSNFIRPTRLLKDVYLGINSDSALKYTIIYTMQWIVCMAEIK